MKCRLSQHRLKAGLVWQGLRREMAADVSGSVDVTGDGAGAGSSSASDDVDGQGVNSHIVLDTSTF